MYVSSYIFFYNLVIKNSIHTLAGISSSIGYVTRSVEAKLALLTVDALCVVLTVPADSTPLVVTMDIHTEPLPVNLSVINTLCAVSVTLACCK